jgi:hypothetical protein
VAFGSGRCQSKDVFPAGECDLAYRDLARFNKRLTNDGERLSLASFSGTTK